MTKKRGDQSKKVLDYLRHNPESSATEIGLYLNSTRNHAGSILSTLRHRGLVAVTELPGRPKRIVFSVADADDSAQVIERARQIGGPFGILAAQVMR